MNAVAVVGTRNPTKTGQRTAFEVSQYLASQGYSIVSGLALGIDTAAHEGALAAMGVTVAVFATPLDKVYPAKNRSLADYVEESGGALVSEWPIGRGTSRQAFVFRDRIQSGLSIAVIPVQTDIEGGTMHTVKYAEKQGRLLLCPRPIPEEADMSQYAGIIHLVQTGRAQEVDTGDLDSLRQILDGHKAWLLAGGNSSPEGEEYSQPRLI
jgi:DNA processing protein